MAITWFSSPQPPCSSAFTSVACANTRAPAWTRRPIAKVGRKAILQAETRLNAIPDNLTVEQFLDAAWSTLEELHQQYSRDDVLDPDGWGAGAVGAIQNEILELRGSAG